VFRRRKRALLRPCERHRGYLPLNSVTCASLKTASQFVASAAVENLLRPSLRSASVPSVPFTAVGPLLGVLAQDFNALDGADEFKPKFKPKFRIARRVADPHIHLMKFPRIPRARRTV
jgi:hypothetical protein